MRLDGWREPFADRGHPHGTFQLSAPRTRVSGALALSAGTFRFEGQSGGRGTITLYETSGKRLLKTERDDRQFPGRFTPTTTGG